MRYCNCRDTSIYSLNSRKLPGHFSYGLGMRLVCTQHMPHSQVLLSQALLLWGQTWWDECTWRSPSGNTINDIHDHPEAKQLGVKMEIGLILIQTSPKLGPDVSSGTSHTISVHDFLMTHVPNARLRPSEWSMNLIKSNMLKGLCSLPSLQTKGVPLPLGTPQVMFSEGCAPKSDQIF